MLTDITDSDTQKVIMINSVHLIMLRQGWACPPTPVAQYSCSTLNPSLTPL